MCQGKMPLSVCNIIRGGIKMSDISVFGDFVLSRSYKGTYRKKEKLN